MLTGPGVAAVIAPACAVHFLRVMIKNLVLRTPPQESALGPVVATQEGGPAAERGTAGSDPQPHAPRSPSGIRSRSQGGC